MSVTLKIPYFVRFVEVSCDVATLTEAHKCHRHAIDIVVMLPAGEARHFVDDFFSPVGVWCPHTTRREYICAGVEAADLVVTPAGGELLHRYKLLLKQFVMKVIKKVIVNTSKNIKAK